jgi:hypothetical protein
VSVEPFHLFRYLDEQSFRFNARKGNDQSRFLSAVSAIQDKRVMYQELIGQNDVLNVTSPETIGGRGEESESSYFGGSNSI